MTMNGDEIDPKREINPWGVLVDQDSVLDAAVAKVQKIEDEGGADLAW